jgi:hypothetical protein
MLLAENSICPTCGARPVGSLDHYLPKEQYPLLSVLPLNLTPMCSDCNRKKGTITVGSDVDRFLHPYFDSYENIFSCLIAELQEESYPLAIQYRFIQTGDCINSTRAIFMADKLNLNCLYSNCAASHLAEISSTLRQFFPETASDEIKVYLLNQADECIKHPHVWKTPLYRALAESDWYCRGGYRMQ